MNMMMVATKTIIISARNDIPAIKVIPCNYQSIHLSVSQLEELKITTVLPIN